MRFLYDDKGISTCISPSNTFCMEPKRTYSRVPYVGNNLVQNIQPAAAAQGLAQLPKSSRKRRHTSTRSPMLKPDQITRPEAGEGHE